MEIMNKIHEGEMWHHPHDPNDDIHINEFIPKEGLALINGTQFITSLGCEPLIRSERLARQTAALSLEVLKGTSRAYYPSIHLARPHDGQLFSASILRNLLHNPCKGKAFISEIAISHRHCGKVQDAYTLRCAPQVHGIVHDTLRFIRKILSTEISSGTDNPMIFADSDKQYNIVSGEYPAKVLDYLAIADYGTIINSVM